MSDHLTTDSRESLAALFSEGRQLIAYLTLGYPHPSATPSIVRALEKARVGAIEFGMPTENPKYDGPTIRQTHKVTMKLGLRSEEALRLLGAVDCRHKVLMAYYEDALKIGLEGLFRKAAENGADALLFPDLLIDYPDQFKTYTQLSEKYGLEKAFFVTTTFPHKLVTELVDHEPAFIYLGLMACTGVLLPITIARNIYIMKRLVGPTPLVVGFGISRPEQVMECVKAGAHGVVVGSALAKLITTPDTATQQLDSITHFMTVLRCSLDAKP
jgi:tryptophan synthase alpha chain